MMSKQTDYDAIIIGSGPNGLSAAIRLAQKGLSVLVIEGKDTIGGGTRTQELTLPGYYHDVCSAIHPLGLASPYLRNLPLEKYGLEWIHPTAPFAHPFDDGRAIIFKRSIQETADQLGKDGKAYQCLMTPLAKNWEALMDDFLGPLPLPPKHLFQMTRFGLNGILPASLLAKLRFRQEETRGLFAGMAAHAIMPLNWPATAAFGLMLGLLGHAVGWPMARGGSMNISNAMAKYLKSLGGEIITGQMINSLTQLPDAKNILFDLTAKQILALASSKLKHGYRRSLRNYKYGPGVCKVDWALSEPIPWKNKQVTDAATVHLGGTLAEIATSEKAVWQAQIEDHPYVILVQQSQFDDTRAPAGHHTAWAYCHVPHGSNIDASEQIESQIERYAPGFKDCVIGCSVMNAPQMKQYNPNYVGGDINGGVQNLPQLFTRPAIRWDPYAIPTISESDKFFICSSSTPPGGGVHGMCGFHAAESVLKRMRNPFV